MGLIRLILHGGGHIVGHLHGVLEHREITRVYKCNGGTA